MRLKNFYISFLIVICVGLYFLHIRDYYRKIAPDEIRNINDLLRDIEITAWYEGRVDDLIFFFAKAKTPPTYVLASGPSIYVINTKGEVISWIRDSGDQPSQVAAWNAPDWKEVTPKHVLHHLEKTE